MTFSGRRPNSGDRINRIGKGILGALDALGTAIADGEKHARINQIDQQIADLQQERDHLIVALIEPGDLKVSEHYDPRWTKPSDDEDDMPTVYTSVAGPARLTQCKGRTTTSRYHDAHPGCPYVDTIHNAHEFTLRD